MMKTYNYVVTVTNGYIDMYKPAAYKRMANYTRLSNHSDFNLKFISEEEFSKIISDKVILEASDDVHYTITDAKVTGHGINLMINVISSHELADVDFYLVREDLGDILLAAENRGDFQFSHTDYDDSHLYSYHPYQREKSYILIESSDK